MLADRDPKAAVPPKTSAGETVTSTKSKSHRKFPLINKIKKKFEKKLSRDAPEDKQDGTPSASAPVPPARPTTAPALSAFRHQSNTSTPGSPQPVEPQRPATTRHSTRAPLTIHVNVKFAAPLGLTYANTYTTSHKFEASDEACQGLLHRIDHGCNELITRKDPSALKCSASRRLLRYEVIFTVARDGKVWQVRSYKSYQKQAVDRPTAADITESTDRMIGLFLRDCDPKFHWTPHGSTPPTRDSRITSSHGNDVDLMSSVPHGPEAFSSQNQDFVPGFAIELVFSNKRASRRSASWERRITVHSRQSNPITLAAGEDLTWKLSRSMNALLDARKQFYDQHRSAEDTLHDPFAYEMPQHKDTLHVGFRLHNNVGVDHAHLYRFVDSKLPLFTHPDALDCRVFINELERIASDARKETDATISRLDDLRIVVRDLSGSDWTVKDAFALILDHSTCYSRATTQAILDRVRTGVVDELRGNDVSISLTAVKRGHVVLNKTLVAQANPKSSGYLGIEDSKEAQRVFVSKLKGRVQRDVEMVIRETSMKQFKPHNLRIVERRITPTPSRSFSSPESSTLPSLDELINNSMALAARMEHKPATKRAATEPILETMQADDQVDKKPAEETEPPMKNSEQGVPRPQTPVLTFTKGHQYRESTESSTRRQSTTAASFAMSDVSETETRLSTPSLSEQGDCHDTPKEHFQTPPSFGAFDDSSDGVVIQGADDSGSEKFRHRLSRALWTEEPSPTKNPLRFAMPEQHRRMESSASAQEAQPRVTMPDGPAAPPKSSAMEELPTPGPVQSSETAEYFSTPELDSTDHQYSEAHNREMPTECAPSARPKPPKSFTIDTEAVTLMDDVSSSLPPLTRPSLSESKSSPNAMTLCSRPRSAGFPLDLVSTSHGSVSPPLSRPAVRSRPKSAHAATIFSNPLSFSYSLSPPGSPATSRRSYWGFPSSKFSSPTAGYLGLLHHFGNSPLRFETRSSYGDAESSEQSKSTDEDLQKAMVKRSDRRTLSPRRTSSALLGLKFGQGFDFSLPTRPSSSGAGAVKPASPEKPGANRRRKSLLGSVLFP